MNELNGLHIAVLIVTGFLLLFLIFYMLRTGDSLRTASKKKDSGKREQTGTQRTKPCPLCKEPLKPGETVHSILYPGKPDSLMEIYGCPYCEPAAANDEKTMHLNKRICPVCRKEMPPGTILIARVFEKPGKKHVHVLGCSNCYRGPSKFHSK